MRANFVKEAVDTGGGGTGNLTLTSETGFITFNTAFGTGRKFIYVIEDGNDREVGVGYLSTTTTLVRETIIETLVSGTLDRTSPSAIDAAVGSTVSLSATDTGAGMMPPFFTGSGAAGVLITPWGNETGGTMALSANYIYVLPVYVAVSGMYDTIHFSVSTAGTGSAHLGLYEIQTDGQPGKRLIDFTSGGAVSTASTGIKSSSASAKVHLSAGYYFVEYVTDNAATLRRSPYSFSGLFLGAKSIGLQINHLYRTYTFAALPSDESSAVWSEGTDGSTCAFWLS